MLDDPKATLDRLATKLSRLREAYERDPKFFCVVGGFLTGPPLSEEQVGHIEGEYGLVLLQDYRAFLLRFGDTGTGPGNAFSRLREGLTPGSVEPFPLARPFLGCCSPSHHRLPKSQRSEDYGRLLREWERIPLDHGVLKLSGYGCAIHGVLVLNGPFCGKVWIISGDAAYSGPFGGAEALHDEGAGEAEWEPTEAPKDYPFLEWYESWVDGQLKRLRAGSGGTARRVGR
jgi:hypothetical protein